MLLLLFELVAWLDSREKSIHMSHERAQTGVLERAQTGALKQQRPAWAPQQALEAS